MIDLAQYVESAPSFYGRLRAAMVPALGAVYGETVLPSGGPESSPPVSLRALEAAEGEAVALWRILAHYGAEKPFNPYMRARKRVVVGLKLDTDEIVHYMADDAAGYLDWDCGESVPSMTRAFCSRARLSSVKVVGDIDPEPDYVSTPVAVEMGANYILLNKWRHRGRVVFKDSAFGYLYERRSLEQALAGLSTRRARMEG